MSRPRRRTSARGQQGSRRISRLPKDDETTPHNRSEASNWFLRQSVNSQIYYMKVVFGIITGVISGFLYNDFGASSWWFVPFSGVIIIIIITRYGFKYDTQDLSWPKLFLLSGTMSLFVSFIFTSTLIWLIFFPQNYIY